MPLQAWLQPPQWTLLFMVSTQALLHSIWPAIEQPHAPPLHTEPAGQTLPQAPQFSALFMVSTHAPPGQAVSPVLQLDWQVLPLQTWPPVHAVEQLPQWLASEETQAPPQASRPAVHMHALAWQVWPVPQAVPQAPQFC
jgi:hypothetical protein